MICISSTGCVISFAVLSWLVYQWSSWLILHEPKDEVRCIAAYENNTVSNRCKAYHVLSRVPSERTIYVFTDVNIVYV
jgi:hypothetical protein